MLAVPAAVLLQVDAGEDMWGGAGRTVGGKVLLDDPDVDDDLVVGLGVAGAGAAADGSGGSSDLMVPGDNSSAAAMDAGS